MTTANWEKQFKEIAFKPAKTEMDEVFRLAFLESAIKAFEPPHSELEAQALLDAKRALKRLNDLKGHYLTEIGNTEIMALCGLLDSRVRKANRKKGIPQAIRPRQNKRPSGSRFLNAFTNATARNVKRLRQRRRHTVTFQGNGVA